MPDVAIVLTRSLLAYTVLLLLTRLMGKQIISQLTFFEFVVGITIGDIASSMAMDINSVTFTEGLTAMLVMAGVTIFLATLQLRSLRIRKLLEGKPTVLIRNGRILEKNLAREHFTIEDLMSQLRLQQIFDVNDVETALLETNGRVSVLLKRDRQHLRPRDFGLHVRAGTPVVLVEDGKISKEGLAAIERDESWLRGQLAAYGIGNERDAFFVQMDGAGNLYVDVREPTGRSVPSRQSKLVCGRLLEVEAGLETCALRASRPEEQAFYTRLAKRVEAVRKRLTPHLPP